jgi:hypothetical protein
VEQYFQDVPLVVSGFPSIIHSLHSYTSKELLTGDNKYFPLLLLPLGLLSLPLFFLLSFFFPPPTQTSVVVVLFCFVLCFFKTTTKTKSKRYFCERCNGKVDAVKGLRFRQLPKVLILSLLRFEYDYERDQRTKNCSSMHFPLLLDMSPYCSEAVEEQEISQQRQQETQEFEGLKQPEVNPNSDLLYELFAVVIHRGKNAQFGHYHVYIQDVSSSKHSDPTEDNRRRRRKWFDFDDSSVKPIEEKELTKQFGGASECAYMLIYRKVEHLNDGYNNNTQEGTSESTIPTTTATTSSSSSPPSSSFSSSPMLIPEYLLREVEQTNTALKTGREEYELLQNQIEVVIHSSNAFFIVDGMLHLKENQTKEGEAEEEEEEVEQIFSHTITIDKRAPLKSLKDHLLALFGGKKKKKNLDFSVDITLIIRTLLPWHLLTVSFFFLFFLLQIRFLVMRCSNLGC